MARKKTKVGEALLTSLSEILNESKWKTSRFTTEYGYYDKVNDQILVQVFSQGMIGYYIMFDELTCDYSYNNYNLYTDQYEPLGLL